jgi:hypothetical protein
MLSDRAIVNELIPIVGEAHEAARKLSDRLGSEGHAQANEATIIFQQLTTIQIQLFNATNLPRIADLAQTLSSMATRCVEGLGELRSVLDRAAVIASSGK